MKKNPYLVRLILLLALSCSFVEQTMAQQLPDLKKAKHFAVLSAKTLTDNNVLQVHGLMGAKHLQGTSAAPDSVLLETDDLFLQAIADFNFTKDSLLNLTNQTPFDLTAGDYNAAVYSSNAPITTLNGGGYKFIGTNTDAIIINIIGDLKIESTANIILDGILPENVFWNVTGKIEIEEGAILFGTFMADSSIIINKNISGAFSVFSNKNILITENYSLFSSVYLGSSQNILASQSCGPNCIESNLIFNGNFNNSPICDIFDSNGFTTDLKYSIPCGTSTSHARRYKIDNTLNNWNLQWTNVTDHAGNNGNLMFIDGFGDRDFDYNPAPFDTVNTIVWQQTISNVEINKRYMFSLWATNLNLSNQNGGINLIVLFNGVEYQHNRVNIKDNIIQWTQFCMPFMVPNDPSFSNLTITIRQTAPFNTSGIDFAIDDLTFGKYKEETLSISASNSSDVCTGNSSLLTIINPIPNYTYQWLFNGQPIPNAFDLTLLATASGVYSVRANSTGGCLAKSQNLIINLLGPVDENTFITISSNAIWTKTQNPFNSINSIKIKNELRIKAGVNLTIKGMRFEFGPNATVILEPGATLTLTKDNANLPTVFTSYSCVGVMWQGIKIQSLNLSIGKLQINEACVIENAHIAVSNAVENEENLGNGASSGYVIANSAIFRNNYIAVQLIGNSSNILQPAKSNNSSFYNCQFICNSFLKDRIKYIDGIHKTFVDFAYIKNVTFENNFFSNTIALLPPANVNNVYDLANIANNKGITSLNSNYLINLGENKFSNLYVGIDYNSSNSALGNQKFENIKFLSNAYGIILRGGSNILVSSCNFELDPIFNSNDLGKAFVGINCRGTQNPTLEENTFNDGYCGIITNNISLNGGKSLIYGNTFINTGAVNKGKGQGIYSINNNKGLQVKCNSFIASNLVQNHWVTDANLPAQGYCDFTKPNAPAGNTFNGIQPANADIFIKKLNSAFKYHTHDKYIPIISPIMKQVNAGNTIQDITNNFVFNCDQYYFPSTACEITIPTSLNELIDSLNLAIALNQDSIAMNCIYEVLAMEEMQDSLGIAKINFLNELAFEKAKWLLVAEYINQESYLEATNLLEILPAITEEEIFIQSFYMLQCNLNFNNRRLLKLSTSDSVLLQNIANANLAISFEAQAILNYNYDLGYWLPLPIDNNGENQRQQLASTLSDELILFPNPANDLIQVNFENTSKTPNLTLQVVNLLGTEHFVGNFENKMLVNCVNFKNGIYFIKISSDQKTIATKKIIIAH